MIKLGVLAAVGSAASWVAAPFVSMAVHGTINGRTRAAMRA